LPLVRPAIVAPVLAVAVVAAAPPSTLVPSANARLLTVPSAGGRISGVAGGARFATISRPRFSPDGRTIAFGAQRCSRCSWRLDLLRAGGGPVHAIFDGALEPDWSPDGHVLAFVRPVSRSGVQQLRLYLVDRDGRHARRLGVQLGSSPSGFQLFHNPTFARHPPLMAFEKENRRTQREQVFVLDRRTGNARLLTPAPAAQPAFSPDGSTLVYACEQPDGSDDICIVRRDGKRRRILVRTAGDDEHPTFSPDGKTVVFDSDVADRTHGFRSIYAVASDGRGLRRLTSGLDAAEPAFAPDGRRLVFVGRAIERR
jgi:TolB protein